MYGLVINVAFLYHTQEWDTTALKSVCLPTAVGQATLMERVFSTNLPTPQV